MLLLSVHVTPNSRENAIISFDGQMLDVKIAAPPINGKANRELIRFLAEKLGTAPSAISIVSGFTSRQKRLQIPDGITLDKLQKKGKYTKIITV